MWPDFRRAEFESAILDYQRRERRFGLTSAQVKGDERAFRCDLELLLREMRYFRAHLAGVADPSSRRVEMAVHCDVAVFAWLLDWVRAKEARRRREGDVEAADPAEAADDVPAPTLTPSNAVPVLVSSDFLRMDALADECLAFISDRLEDVARGPLDVAALDTRLLRRLARVTPAARLESLRSEGGNRTASPSRRRESVDLSRRASALAEALFERKTELEFFEGALRGRFARCDRCDRLFVAPGGAARGNSPTLPRELCAAAPRRVDYRGEVVAPHVPRAGPFDLRADVEALARIDSPPMPLALAGAALLLLAVREVPFEELTWPHFVKFVDSYGAEALVAAVRSVDAREVPDFKRRALQHFLGDDEPDFSLVSKEGERAWFRADAWIRSVLYAADAAAAPSSTITTS